MNKNIKSLINLLKSSGMIDAADEILKIAQDKSLGTLYHGSPNKFYNFERSRSNYRGLTYFTSSRSMAEAFAGGRGLDHGYIYTVSFPNTLNLFDPSNLENLELLRPIIKSLVKARFKDTLTGADFNPSGTIYLNGQEIIDPTDEQMVEYVMWKVKNKAWRTLEGEQIVEFLTNSGYDGLITREGGNDNVGIFDPALIKIENIEEIKVEPD